MTNFLANGNRNLYAIGVLFKRNYAMSSIHLEENKNTILLDDSLIEFLKVYLVDSEKHDSDRCNIFEELHAPFAQNKYAIREFSFKDGKDLSLNRCTIETEGFIPEKFKLGNPTPGSDNDCSGSHFIFEDRIQEILPNIITSVDIENSDANYAQLQLGMRIIIWQLSKALKIILQMLILKPKEIRAHCNSYVQTVEIG